MLQRLIGLEHVFFNAFRELPFEQLLLQVLPLTSLTVMLTTNVMQRLVSRDFKALATADEVWKSLCLARWQWLSCRQGGSESWKRLFDKGCAYLQVKTHTVH